MSKVRIATLGAVAAGVVGLAASLTSLVDDLGGAPTFCAETGCETVRTSAWAKPLGIPMSAIGALFFTAMLVLAFVEAPRLRRWLAVAGGAWAIWLIALQAFVIDAWCKLCLVADPAAIAQAVFVVAGARAMAPEPRRVIPIVPAAAAIVAVLAMWTQAPAAVDPVVAAAGTPESVASAQVAGAVTVVEFVDFQCPFCREMQARLERAMERTQTPVRIVRKMVPLPGHKGAMPAAVAWCCADAQGRGDAMAKALFEAPIEELTPAGCEAIAVRVGCDLERYRADIAAAQQRIQRDDKDAEAAGVKALPTLFIGSERINGASATIEELVAMIDRTPRS